MLHTGRRHGHVRSQELCWLPGWVCGGTSGQGWQESGRSRESPQAAAWTHPKGTGSKAPVLSHQGQEICRQLLPSNSPQEWSGTSFLGQYPSKRNYFLIGFEMTNRIHQNLKSQNSSKAESYI